MQLPVHPGYSKFKCLQKNIASNSFSTLVDYALQSYSNQGAVALK